MYTDVDRRRGLSHSAAVLILTVMQTNYLPTQERDSPVVVVVKRDGYSVANAWRDEVRVMMEMFGWGWVAGR